MEKWQLEAKHISMAPKWRKEQYIEENLTQADIDAWHSGECTEHVVELMEACGVDQIQIWGGASEGTEPLSVIV